MSLIAVVSIFAVTYAQNNPSIVSTEYGDIKGLLLEHARVFRSIPFASPPVGDLRWKNPEPPKSWTSTLDCTHEVVGCPQSCKHLPLTSTECPDVIREDCLYVNVWTPLTATPSSNLPVLLFIHGGGFTSGYGGGLLYNGTRMVHETNNSIVVTINYRLGALGSLYDSQLGLQGNYGYKDQLFAIEWAHRNIINFGGNPKRIVIFGESAGGHSVALHLLNKTSVIAGAIMESPPLGLPLRTAESWGTLPLTFSKEVGCDPNTLSPTDRLKCLRTKNITQIVSAQASANNDDPQDHYSLIQTAMPWTPTVGHIDGGELVFVDQPLTAIKKGEYNTKIQWMAGTNSGEAFLFTPPFVSYHDLTTKLADDLGKNNAAMIEGFYNITTSDRESNLFQQYGTILTDFMFRCPTRNITESSAQIGENIGYFYHYNYVASYAEHVWYYQPLCWTHVCHTEELPLVFDPNTTSIDVHPTNDEILAANQIQFYWTNFAETGNPSIGKNANNLNVKWLDFGSNVKQQTLMINNVGTNGFIMQNTPDDTICKFWDSLGFDWFNGTNW
eukprot:446630_1